MQPLSDHPPLPQFRAPTWQWGLSRLLVLLLVLLVLVPVVSVFGGWLQPETEIWRHLAETVLGDLVRNTLVLLIGVGIGVLVLGVGLAWLTSFCDFPGRRIFDWALMLPLALPAYVLAFVVLGLFDYGGPLEAVLNRHSGGTLELPDMRSAGGVILVLVLVLYPYVYLLSRSAFLTQGEATREAARMLGLGPWACFFRVTLPMARPAIVAGLALVMMETLADFGTVAVFNYDTFTTAIYKVWFGFYNLEAASQLASLLLLLVLLVLSSEAWLRGRARFYESGHQPTSRRYRLHGWRAWLASACAATVLSLAFVIPLVQLLNWALDQLSEIGGRYLDLLFNTLLLGLLAAFLILASVLLLGILRYNSDHWWLKLSVRLGTLGYALPGSVLAVGLLVGFSGLDGLISRVSGMLGGQPTGQLLGGSLWVLVVAYLVRFMAVGYGPVEGGLARIRPSLPESARSLGLNRLELFLRVYLPLLRPGILTALLLVLVDVMKEMPATLLLRPFGWDTLAVRIFEMTSEGEWERAALPSLTLVLLGLLPVLVLVRQGVRGGER